MPIFNVRVPGHDKCGWPNHYSSDGFEEYHLRFMASYIPILTYHSIDSSRSVISLSAELFQRQMAFLAASGFSVLPLSRLLSLKNKQEEFPEKCIALTFDDGFKNFSESALPILRHFGFSATVFLITGRCGEDNDWPGQMDGLPRLPMLDWNDIESAAKQGIEFGAHTVTHPNLTKLTREQYAEEILASKTVIKERVGQEVSFFAYPYGIFNREVHHFVGEHFDGACSVTMDFMTKADDPFLLPRVDMYYFSQNNMHRYLGTSLGYGYVKARKILRRVKTLIT